MQFTRALFIVLAFLVSLNLSANTEGLNTFSAKEVLTGLPEKIEAKGHKGIVVTFLSAKCPCSHSHITELTKLAQENPDFLFVGVHSNQDESKEVTHAYFENAKLPFKVLDDEKAVLAERFKAFKTPHTFIVGADGEILYKGGVSSSPSFVTADHKYLREAIDDIKAGQKVRTPEGRTLGCAITRGN